MAEAVGVRLERAQLLVALNLRPSNDREVRVGIRWGRIPRQQAMGRSTKASAVQQSMCRAHGGPRAGA